MSEFELLQIIIGSGSGQTNVSVLARNVQKLLQKGLDELTYDKLTQIKGLSTAKASSLIAAVELSRRYVIDSDEPLRTAEDFAVALGDLATKRQEHLVCLSLDGANRLIARRTIAIGILDSVLVHPREVFADAIADRAASVVVGHNHPSGETDPSNFDIGFNQQLIAASRIIGINLIDHLIITKRGFTSFKQTGLII